MYKAYLVKMVTGVKQDTIRNWCTRAGKDKRGLARSLDHAGYNDYSRADVFRIGLMAHLIREGFSINDSLCAIRLNSKEFVNLSTEIPGQSEFGPVLMAEFRANGTAAFTIYRDRETLERAFKMKFLVRTREPAWRNQRVEAIDLGECLRDLHTKIEAIRAE